MGDDPVRDVQDELPHEVDQQIGEFGQWQS
jgi:hypothetical protein